MLIYLGNLTAHLSSLIHPDRKIFAFSVASDSHTQIEDKLERMAARSIFLLRLSSVYFSFNICVHIRSLRVFHRTEMTFGAKTLTSELHLTS